MNDPKFQIARKLSAMAVELDEFNSGLNRTPGCINCVLLMHQMAEALAGDRSNEIYAPDDENLLSGHPDEVVA